MQPFQLMSDSEVRGQPLLPPQLRRQLLDFTAQVLAPLLKVPAKEGFTIYVLLKI